MHKEASPVQMETAGWLLHCRSVKLDLLFDDQFQFYWQFLGFVWAIKSAK